MFKPFFLLHCIYVYQGRRRFFFKNSGNGKTAKTAKKKRQNGKRQNGKLKKNFIHSFFSQNKRQRQNGKKKAAKRQTATTLMYIYAMHIYIYAMQLHCIKKKLHCIYVYVYAMQFSYQSINMYIIRRADVIQSVGLA
jgi:hypothetical protein